MMGGREYLLRPSFEALADIESRTGRSLLEILNDFAGGKAGFKTTATVIWCCHLASRPEPGRAPSLNDIGELIVKEGLFKIAPEALKVLVGVLNRGNDEAKKKVEPTAPITSTAG